MRECNCYEITLEKYLNFVHRYTERIAIYVVIGEEWFENRKIKGLKRLRSFYLTTDAMKDKEMLLKYFKDIPLWNCHLEIYRSKIKDYASIEYMLVANCYFRDIKEAFLQAKKDKAIKVENTVRWL